MEIHKEFLKKGLVIQENIFLLRDTLVFSRKEINELCSIIYHQLQEYAENINV